MLGVAVKTAGDALYIACEMEKRAVKLYERAALIWPDGPIAAAIGDMLSQEREHLRRFTHMLSGRVPEHAEALVLSARAAGILFDEGLGGAAREGAFASPAELLAYAAGQEALAVDCYTQFAAACAAYTEAQAAFLAIAQEEGQHLATLKKAQNK